MVVRRGEAGRGKVGIGREGRCIGEGGEIGGGDKLYGEVGRGLDEVNSIRI